MAHNHIIKFRVTKAQHERMLQEARVRGYLTLSEYMRDLALNKFFRVESQIVQTYENVKKIMELMEIGRGIQDAGMGENLAEACGGVKKGLPQQQIAP